MPASQTIVDYLGSGTHAARPATPNLPSNVIGVYYETDTHNWFGWTGAAWAQINVSSAGTFAGLTDVNLAGASGQKMVVYDDTVPGIVLLPIPSGGGGSTYNAPVLADFTNVHTYSGCSLLDKPSGLAMVTPSVGGGFVLHYWTYNTAPGATFDYVIGVNWLCTNGAYSGQCLTVGDAAGNIVSFGIHSSTYYMGQAYNWTSPTAEVGQPIAANCSAYVTFFRVTYDGVNYKYYSGTDINNMYLLSTIPLGTFLGAPTVVGIAGWGFNQSVIGTYFHLSLV